MRHFFSGILLTFLLTPITSSSAANSQTTFSLVDQNNKPLANAVIDVTLNTKEIIGEAAADNALSTKTEPDTQAPVYIMDQIDKSFVPSVLVVPKDSLVSFPNSDDIRHHVYSFSSAKPFELKLYAGRDKAPLPFNNSGVVVLGCNIHDSMVGYIYVSEQSKSYLSNEQGLIEAPFSVDDIAQLTLWHPYADAGVEHREVYQQAQLKIIDGKVHFSVNVNLPEPRDSFENLISNDY